MVTSKPIVKTTGVFVAAMAAGFFALAPAGGFAADGKDSGSLNSISPASANAGAPAGDAGGGQTIKQGDPVVAVVDGESIKRSEVFTFIGQLPEKARQTPIEQLFPAAVEQVVVNHLVGARAKAANLDNDKDVVKLMGEAKQQIVRNVYMQHQLDSMVTQKQLMKAYEKLLDDNTGVEEVHAHQILSDSEEKAKEIVKKLDGGAKFDDLAKDSKGATGEGGGDLGYFAEKEIIPEIGKVAFSTKPGEYTKTPVKTQFGWHVLKIDEKRKRPEPKFDDVKSQLEAQVRQQTVEELLGKWQKDAKIQKFDINGDPVKDKEAKDVKDSKVK